MKYRSPPKPKNATFKAQTFYALRFIRSGEYVDPRKVRAQEESGRSFVSVRAESDPVLNANRALVVEAWKTHETHRLQRRELFGESEWNKLEIVVFKTGFVDEGVDEQPEIDPAAVKSLLIGYHYGQEAKLAYDQARQKSDVSEYTMFLRRKGGKALMDELMPNNFSYGSVTFLRDEAELVQARLILGDTKSAVYYSIVDFPKH